MNLGKQVTSQKLSERLKALGVKQESYFWWAATWAAESGEDRDDYELVHHLNEAQEINEEGNKYAAFTVAELGEMLPSELEGGWYLHTCSPRGGGTQWLVWYENEHNDKLSLKNQSHKWLIVGNNEAESRGLMLAYLIENELLSV